MRRLLPAIAIALVSSAAFADEAPQATGKFTGSKVEFKVTGAYGYWSRAKDEGDVIEIAVSNEGFKASVFDTFYDPKPVISEFFADEETAVVYFQFEPNGKYHGMSYYLGSGDGCGFCYDPSVVSTVKIAGNRAKGDLRYKSDNRAFNITIDAPIAPKVWGPSIKGDGGDIGKAYKAYNAVMLSGDRKAQFDALDSVNQATWKKRQKDGKLDRYLEYRDEKVHYRLKEARIVGGFQRENQAVLLIKGSSPLLDHIHGQVTLTKEAGQWKISDEVYEVGE
jgi:hypothetical protein